jgi:hypothetical protein
MSVAGIALGAIVVGAPSPLQGRIQDLQNSAVGIGRRALRVSVDLLLSLVYLLLLQVYLRLSR